VTSIVTASAVFLGHQFRSCMYVSTLIFFSPISSDLRNSPRLPVQPRYRQKTEFPTVVMSHSRLVYVATKVHVLLAPATILLNKAIWNSIRRWVFCVDSPHAIPCKVILMEYSKPSVLKNRNLTMFLQHVMSISTRMMWRPCHFEV
jgi:hypothetical protein